MGRSKWVETDKMRVILALLTVENQLAMQMTIRYGMRIGDVLRTKTQDVVRGSWTYKEEKTGKRRRITLSKDMQQKLLSISGRCYIFEHRTDWKKHRTRQAVWKDMKRAAHAMRLQGTVSPHSGRKVYAVERYKAVGLEGVQRLLNHEEKEVTLLYALADRL